MTAPGRKPDLELQSYVQAIVAAKINSSFFVPDAQPDQLEFLRKPVLEAGVGIEIIRVEVDEIYQQPGVRIFRREGEYDEL